MSVFSSFKIKVVKKAHWDNGCDQKEDGEFAQDGGVFKRGHKNYFFIIFHNLTVTLISPLEQKKLVFLSSTLNSIAY